MKACASCPARLMARLFESLGDEDAAREIREAGCNWWWKVPMHNQETGQVKDVEICGAEMLPKYFHDYGVEIKLASGTIQADRAEQKNALDAIRETANALGYPDTLAMLAELGFRAAVGHEVVEKQRLAEGSSGEGVPE